MSVIQTQWKEAYATCPTWKSTWDMVISGHDWPNGISLRGHQKQYMYLDHRICVPESLAVELISEWHTNLGHQGVNRTIQDVSQRFTVPHLSKFANVMIKGCQLCQAVKKPNLSKNGDWTSVPVPPRPGSCISMDIVTSGQAKTWEGKKVDSALVIVDRHTGWIDAYHVDKSLTAKQAAYLMNE
jgi:hypothetical protein